MNLNVTYGKKSGQIGGGRPVFDQRQRQTRVADGAMILNPPAVGGIMFMGDLAEFNEANHTCKHLKVFEVAKTFDGSATAVLIKRGEYNHVLQTGLKLMSAPSAFSADGLYVTVGAVTATTDSLAGDVYSFAITAGALGANGLAAGTLLVECDAANAILSYTISTAGTDYVVGDILTVTQAGGSLSAIRVTAVDGDTGAIEATELVSGGKGYAKATALATTTDSTAGTGAKVDITAIGGKMVIQNPNTCFTHDVYIDETPATLADWSDGFKYAVSLFNSATLIECMATKIPAVAKANLRTGYSDIRVINYI